MENKWFEHVSTQYDMEMYKKKIKGFSRYSDENKKRFFQKEKYGIIVQKYPNEFETLIYEKIAKLIVQRYPEFVDENDIVNTLKSAGKIYTMKVDSSYGYGFYHLNSADIGVFAYLDRISEELLHEVIHKLGYLKFNPEFYDMDVFYKEAGTEIVTNKTLGKKECKECIVRGVWVKSYGPDQEYLVQVALVNQIDQILGGHTLEKSILQGSNEFQRKMEEELGKEFSDDLSKKIKEIIAYTQEYWKNYVKNGNDDRREENIMKLLQRFQNDLMHKVFDRLFDNVQDEEEAVNVLRRLLDFSDYRFKRKVDKDGEVLFTDDEFKKYFDESKYKLEKRFNTKFDIEYDENEWSRNNPIEMVSDDEKARRAEERKSIIGKARYTVLRKDFRVLFSRKNDKQKFTSDEGIAFTPDENWIEKVELSFEKIKNTVDKETRENKSTQDLGVDFKEP